MKNNKNTYVGICLGASTISVVEILVEDDIEKIIQSITRPHLGNVKETFLAILKENDHLHSAHFCVTGRKLKNTIQLSSIAEPEAVELAAKFIFPNDNPYRYIISAGGETFILYHLDESGSIQDIQTGNKCASGTGEFFLQQLHRMDLSIADIEQTQSSKDVYKVSGRCSVFCKSDCTHALNKGVPKADVVGGLSAMMAEKIDELFGKLPRENVIITGGCSKNAGMVHHLKKKIHNLFIPEEASFFEAIGAASWAIEHDTLKFPGLDQLFTTNTQNFSYHQPLKEFNHLVTFKERPFNPVQSKCHAILGLDVGSTTTKGVILRKIDHTVIASVYLRTNGDPIAASKKVYQALAEQLTADINIVALGVTGSGRQIAGLHGSATGIINEIIAHATAATFFDPEVDTIFEIGGQDAKYTHLSNGVPSDYAMNEACSAGTGSFLEEATRESLGITVDEIGDIAFRGNNPPNFNDQCAAFISSDIKSAAQQGLENEDIVAGLVYSVCLNYINRVIANRPIGKKIFVQGGVCYNKAIPAAMAALTGKQIIVPPDPGLMGAFGVALEIDKRIDQGLLKPKPVILKELACREVSSAKSFICRGGKNGCDNKCSISMIKINGKSYPFGGICNRFDNLKQSKNVDISAKNVVTTRQKIIFKQNKPLPYGSPSVRMNRSFLQNTYYPFFQRYFQDLGYTLLLPERIDPSGIAQRGASFCYPVEVAHGYLADMLHIKADFTFLPQLKGLPGSDHDTACTCVFVQSEPFYLKAAFPTIDTPTTLTPAIDLSKSVKHNRKLFGDIAKQLGRSAELGKNAFINALANQEGTFARLQKIGTALLEELAHNPDDIAIVLFGRPYNAFTNEANKGIPLKLASRNIRVIPFDMLPYNDEQLAQENNMYWAMGNMLLKCAHFVANHPQLFGTFITNFSCGPDSFIVSYFRDIMKDKPNLTLELDSHTADAGIETRIEAFLDIISAFRNYKKNVQLETYTPEVDQAGIEMKNNVMHMRTASGELVPLTDDRVRIVIPTLGRYSTPLFAKAMQGNGIKVFNLPPADEKMLKLGKDNSNCKECLPLQTTLGSILNYVQNDRPDGELTIYLMPSAPGPCRFGQYNIFTKRTMQQHNLRDIIVVSPNSENSYGGFSIRFLLLAIQSAVIADLFEEMRSTILAGASDKEHAMQVLNNNYEKIEGAITKKWKATTRQIKESAAELSTIKLKRAYAEIPKISLIGEIYVRHDPISLQHLVEKLAERGFIVRIAHITEWLKYIDWLVKKGILGKKNIRFWATHFMKEHAQSEVRKLLAPSGLFHDDCIDIDAIVSAAEKYISPQLQGETILTVGSAFHDIMNPACGVISIGPFGCMPSRVAEAILKEKFNITEKRAQMNGKTFPLLTGNGDRRFPFLAIETDGKPFPQIIEARIEAFCMQAERLHAEMMDLKN